MRDLKLIFFSFFLFVLEEIVGLYVFEATYQIIQIWDLSAIIYIILPSLCWWYWIRCLIRLRNGYLPWFLILIHFISAVLGILAINYDPYDPKGPLMWLMWPIFKIPILLLVFLFGLIFWRYRWKSDLLSVGLAIKKMHFTTFSLFLIVGMVCLYIKNKVYYYYTDKHFISSVIATVILIPFVSVFWVRELLNKYIKEEKKRNLIKHGLYASLSFLVIFLLEIIKDIRNQNDATIQTSISIAVLLTSWLLCAIYFIRYFDRDKNDD